MHMYNICTIGRVSGQHLSTRYYQSIGLRLEVNGGGEREERGECEEGREKRGESVKREERREGREKRGVHSHPGQFCTR